MTADTDDPLATRLLAAARRLAGPEWEAIRPALEPRLLALAKAAHEAARAMA
ncbi:MAG: hypothetical protein NZM40_03630 [Sphingomonadaceae bacterium]|uniref:hypothetical protein n=1 Tax=Thermaurantiacus sp. TaxID=2820283 RepID=UPI00298F14DB|nr:hypothetical protein [Thermaurantiacus sp.]MCS6986514.1 hypothetical protein [Sphingomonadaceae bacterium]MDW8414225.1 hypothetical protein [Thermaurantiacus sp.]